MLDAQETSTWKEIKGVVVDKNEDLSIEGVFVSLLNSNDSSVVKSMVTDKNGAFSFSSVQKKNYLLKISLISYNAYFKQITPSGFPVVSIDVGKIALSENGILLSELVVEAEVPEVVVKEDTLEYNPGAFKMTESAVVEDLLKRLPGIEVEQDGKIKTTAGKDVSRVFVDGKPFFGNDPKMTTKNVTLDVVDKVQVVTKKSDMELLTGVADGEEETIINITIKKGMKKGWISNSAAGLGGFIDNPTTNDLRYTANTFTARFMDSQQIGITVNVNNINNQGSTDGGNQSRSGMRSGGGRGSNAGSGMTSSATAGINYMNAITDKLKIGGDVSYNYSDELVDRKSFRQNILKADSVSYRNSESIERGYSNNARINSRIEFDPDSLNSFVLNTRLEYNFSSSNDYTLQTTRAGDADSTLVNKSDAHSYLESDGLVFATDLTYARKFEKKGRRFSITGGVDINHSSGTGTNHSINEFFLQPNKNTNLNQESENTSARDNYRFRISYVEPVWKTNNTLQFSYDARYNTTDNVRETFDYDSIAGTYTILNPNYSKSMKNKYLNQTFGISFNAVHEKYNYNIGINIIPSYTQSTNYVKNGDMDGNDSILNKIPGREVINYSPQLTYMYRFTRRRNLQFTYRGRTNQPSVSQLDPTPNNTNPLNIRYGNPDLLPEFSHTMNLRYGDNNPLTSQNISANISGSFTQNQIINFTSYEDTTGIQTTAPINENGSWRMQGDFVYSISLGDKKKFRISSTTGGGYNNQVGFIKVDKQSERNVSGTISLSEAVGLSYSKDWFYGQLRGNIRYSDTKNTLKGRQNQKNANYGLTYNTQLFLPYDFQVSSDVNFRATRGLTQGYNTNETVWNAEVSKLFLSKKQATIRFKWNDILQQALNINRNVTASYIEDRESNVLTSYFLVSFAYRFNQMGGGRSSRNSRTNSDENQEYQQYRQNNDMPRERGNSRSGGRNR